MGSAPSSGGDKEEFERRQSGVGRCRDLRHPLRDRKMRKQRQQDFELILKLKQDVQPSRPSAVVNGSG
jgi:hypothetical protein